MSAGPRKNKTKEILLIRADAGSRVGLGHVMRCSALGQAWKESGGNVIFLIPAGIPGLESRLRLDGFEVVELRAKAGGEEDARVTIESAAKEGCSWIVLDGYDFGPEYQTNLRASGTHLLYIDDYSHLDHYIADIVLNQNIDSRPAMYEKRESYTRLLLGSSFILLRREFLDRGSWEREIPPVAKKVLLTMGGADPDNATLKVLQALRHLSIAGLEVAVILGPANPHRERVIGELAHFPIPHRIFNSPPKMSELMSWADLALSGAGSTSWESAFMGLPSILIVLAENQRKIAEGLHRRRIAYNLGLHEEIPYEELANTLEMLIRDQDLREEMSMRGRELIDGRGPNRVIRQMVSIFLTLRPVREEDCELIWKWANEPEVRKASFSAQLIAWSDHVAWFHDKCNDHQSLFFLALDQEGIPVGNIRLEPKREEMVVSVVVAAEFRGRGYGSRIIEMGSAEFFLKSPNEILHAYVRDGNHSSNRAFRNAGFTPIQTLTMGKDKVQHLILEKERCN